ncbi:acyl-CoA dehydrogenase [Marinimicrococcus flavescens]|uniref:3-methylmercaptopropionyl-CoA dehydrogenase n=1 Tax=Marinimicrococcus flavescens TaxID=3031815 RepID=A0AAP3XQC0_9PROT|nr:acyl-CoA dehydrogenase [Marinimicrococcus flavescens]
MTAFTPPLDDIRFVLRHIAGFETLSGLPGLEHATPDLADVVLEEAGRLAANVLAPLNQTGDRVGSVLENGVVRTPPGFKEAYATFAEGGWMGAVFPEDLGGQDLPWTLNTALADIWNAANMTFQLCPLLTQGAVEALLHHGTPEQKETYARSMIEGRWTGAMCLTEPQAGSDVGALRTRAERDGEHYRIFGQKIFITFGEHDLAENIVHMVLARLPGAPEGTRGISLFIVPKFLPGENGAPGRRNDLRCLKLEEKLGIHASPTCVMSYGDEEGAVGYLLGAENEGMRCMFTMMNNARLAVGHEGLGLAERAYQQALAYARERVQGRRDGRPATIAEFPDVRRTLLRMRAQIAAMRALAYWTGSFVDRAARSADATERASAEGRVALLTPLVKAWCTDLAQEIASAALQVHGGMGFIEETGAAQHLRDARILPIYEGTNGIQALDLAGRKLDMAEGRLPWDLFEELQGELAQAGPGLEEALRAALGALEGATRHLQEAGPEARAAAATPYLRLFASTLGGFLLARGARAAGETQGAAVWPGLARFYIRQILPEAIGLLPAITADPGELDAGLLVA